MKKLLSGLVLLPILAGCAEIQSTKIAKEARTKMIGLTKEQLLQCAGPPASKAAKGETEVWRYNSGGGATSYDSDGIGGTTAVTYYCIIDVNINSDRVQRIDYSGNTSAGLYEDVFCASAIRRCVRN